jgi:RNA polymerase sigma factor (sigma-70 family)
LISKSGRAFELQVFRRLQHLGFELLQILALAVVRLVICRYGSNSRSPEALIERPEDLVEQEEKHEALWAAINRLPEDRRDLLIHKFSSRLSNVEIGDMMNKSESAVKSLYFRTLSSLRDDLEARGWGKLAPEDQGPDRDAVLDERQGSE